jgi:hypothetical protein
VKFISYRKSVKSHSQMKDLNKHDGATTSQQRDSSQPSSRSTSRLVLKMRQVNSGHDNRLLIDKCCIMLIYYCLFGWFRGNIIPSNQTAICGAINSRIHTKSHSKCLDNITLPSASMSPTHILCQASRLFNAFQ